MSMRVLERLVRWLSPSGSSPGTAEAEEEQRQARKRDLALKEDAARQRIISYDRAHWQPLLDLIPEIEATSAFGEWKGLEKTGLMTVNAPWVDPAPVVVKFTYQLHELGGLVPFDWGEWNAGMEMANDRSFDFDMVDIFAKCKVLTTLVRADRVCEGTLVRAFRDGRISNILRSMDRQLPRQ